VRPVQRRVADRQELCIRHIANQRGSLPTKLFDRSSRRDNNAIRKNPKLRPQEPSMANIEIQVNAVEPFAEGQPFGAAGSYLRIRGVGQG